MTSAMRLCSEQWCEPRWLVNLNSGLRPKLSRLVSVFGLSEDKTDPESETNPLSDKKPKTPNQQC